MIIVFGSINMDMTVPVQKFPQPGETVLGGAYEMLAGGKGANQALAAARAGAKVALVGRVGDDGMGMRILNRLRREGVMTSGVAYSPEPTGLAVITVDKDGENTIVVSPGANNDVGADQIPDEILLPKNMLLMQTEITPEETWTVLSRAKESGATTMLNLAPVIKIPQSALDNVDYLIVNQLEARQMAEILKINPDKNTEHLAMALSEKGNLTCIVTMGEAGSVAVTPDGQVITVAAMKLEDVVDKTGAGDAYCGTLAASLHEGIDLPEAMRLASIAGSLACTKKGAQDSYAYIGDVREKLEDFPAADIKNL